MLNEFIVFGVVLEVQSNEPLEINQRKYIKVYINANPVFNQESVNAFRLLVREDQYRNYYSEMKEGDEIVVKGYLRNRYYGEIKSKPKVESNIFVREILKASYYRNEYISVKNLD